MFFFLPVDKGWITNNLLSLIASVFKSVQVSLSFATPLCWWYCLLPNCFSVQVVKIKILLGGKKNEKYFFNY